jgi:2-phospho-L-lactate guanylyltransferase
MQRPIIFIPCKLLNESKSRLAGLLSPDARYDLCVRLLDHTMHAAKLIKPARVFLITADEVAAARAKTHGISVIADPGSLNDALTAARSFVQRVDVLDGPLVVLPIDLVRLNEVALRNSITTSDVTIVPDGVGSGTNLLVLRRDAARDLPFRFGPNSFAQHCSAAYRSNYSVSIREDPALAFDLDSDDDYWRASGLGYLDALEMAS